MSVLDILGKRMLFFDGGMGTMLQKKGVKPGEITEIWNITRPEDVYDVHCEYLVAGADIIMANTFGANCLKLAGTGGLPQEEYRGFGSTYEDGEFILPLDLEKNIRWLHSFLFGEENYTISEEAAERNEYIRNNFQPYN